MALDLSHLDAGCLFLPKVTPQDVHGPCAFLEVGGFQQGLNIRKGYTGEQATHSQPGTGQG